MLIEYRDNWTEIEKALRLAGLRLSSRENPGRDIVSRSPRPPESSKPAAKEIPAES
jgi:hypothetical protein